MRGEIETGPARSKKDMQRMEDAWRSIRSRVDFTRREVFVGQTTDRIKLDPYNGHKPVPLTAGIHRFDFRILSTKAGQRLLRGVFGRRHMSNDPWTAIEEIPQ